MVLPKSKLLGGLGVSPSVLFLTGLGFSARKKLRSRVYMYTRMLFEKINYNLVVGNLGLINLLCAVSVMLSFHAARDSTLKNNIPMILVWRISSET